MRHHFSKKMLVFYGSAIGLVLLLFAAVTRYGNTKLKAPTAIGGDYTLTLSPSSTCPNPTPLVLSIQQSGLYLNAAVDTEEAASKSDQRPFTLDGEWNSEKMSLKGKLPHLNPCAQGQAAKAEPVQLEGTLKDKTLIGQMSLGSSAEALAFTAQPKEASAKPPAAH